MWCPLSLLILSVTHSAVYGSPSCRGKDNTPVDWFIMYKFPALSTSASPATRAGLGYAYMDSNDLILNTSPQNVNDTRNPLFFTLQQIYEAQNFAPLAHIMYNDESAVTGISSTTVGHSKGTAAWDENGGFWLLHSVPGWPPAANTSYSFGRVNAPTYGQTFLCTTMDAANLNVVFNQWAWTRPGVYSFFFPPTMNATFPGAAAVLAGQKVSAEPWTSVLPVATRDGLQFTYFVKYTKWGKELYEDLVAPLLGVNLNAATWQNGIGSINSSCMPNFTWNVQNIGNISISADAYWPNSKDHAKWAIADSCGSAPTALWVCIGDINRQTGQFNRAGGLMCTRQYQVYSAFQRMITGFKLGCTNSSVCPPPGTPSPTLMASPAFRIFPVFALLSLLALL